MFCRPGPIALETRQIGYRTEPWAVRYVYAAFRDGQQ